MVVILVLIILFFTVCVWDYVPSIDKIERTLFPIEIENFEKKVGKLPKGYAMIKKDEQIGLTRKPLLVISSLKPYFESLSHDNMSFVFELTMNENDLPERDLMSFETLTHFHRVSFTKKGPIRKMKLTTKAFPPSDGSSSTDHNESIRLYEFKDFVDKTTKQREGKVEGFETVGEEAARKKFVPVTVQYAICYSRETSMIYENGATEKGVFAQIEQFDPITNIDFAKEEVIVFVGSSDVTEIDSYLVRNLVVYNGVIGVEELGLLPMIT